MKKTEKEYNPSSAYNIYNDTDGGFRRLKQKNNIRHIKQRIYYVAVLVLLVVIFALAVVLIFFRVSDVKVEGNTVYKDKEIVKASGIEEGVNIYMISEGDVQAKLLTEFPYIRTVNVEKNIPNTVTLDLECDSPSYYLEIGKEYFVISGNLRVVERFMTKDEMLEKHPDIRYFRVSEIRSAIVGSELEFIHSGYSESAKSFLKVLEGTEIFEEITSVYFDDRFNICVVYDNRLKANVGNGESADLKLRFMKEIVEDLGNVRGTIDIKDVEKAYVLLDGTANFD